MLLFDEPDVNLSGSIIVLLAAEIGFRVMTKIILERTGCTVFAVKDREELNNLLDLHYIDLVIFDVDVQDPDALNLFSHLRSRPSPKKTPILVFVPRGYKDVVAKCLEAGATDYLLKPILDYDLLRKVDAMLKPS